ncbi:MAG: hypothetical protein AAGG46_03875 [Planctomycetota bacterium]
MDLYVQIGLGTLVLATLILAFLATKVWHWAHVLVVVGLVFASIGYVLLLTPSMRTRIKWQKQYAQAEQKLEETLPFVAALQRGTDNPQLIRGLENRGLEFDDDTEQVTGVRVLREKVRLGSRLRGRTWTDAEPGRVDNRSGEVTVTIENPQPLGIEQDGLVVVFEQGPPAPNSPADGAQYLGEFRVVGVGDQQVTLAPVRDFDDQEADRLLSSRGPWVLHETMPVDDRNLFVGMPEDQLRALFPEAVIDEYLREGTPWTADDGEETRLGIDDDDNPVGPDDADAAVRFVYRRQLRDYSASFQDLARQRVELLSDIQALEADNAKLATALAGAKKLQTYREETGRKLRSDLGNVERDLQAIEKHLAGVMQQAEKADELLSQTLAANTRLVARLTAAQASAAGRDLQANPTPSRPAVDIDAL